MKIQERYRAAMAQGRWKDAYATTSASEYFAELAMWYFGSRGNEPRDVDVRSGRE